MKLKIIMSLFGTQIRRFSWLGVLILLLLVAVGCAWNQYIKWDTVVMLTASIVGFLYMGTFFEAPKDEPKKMLLNEELNRGVDAELDLMTTMITNPEMFKKILDNLKKQKL